MMIQAATVFAVLLAAASCQQLMQQQFSVVDPNSGQTGSVGFMPMKDDRRGSETIPERRTSEPAPESSSPQSRDYSGGPEFYGYNNYPASYGPPSSSYGSSGTAIKRLNLKPKCDKLMHALKQNKKYFRVYNQ